MKSVFGKHSRVFLGLLSVALMSTSALARVQFPVATAYEDSVRILILYNLGASAQSVCSNMPMVGTSTMQFVKAALDTTFVKNVKTSTAHNASIATVAASFDGKAPHAVVHVNAGWGGLSGPNMKDIAKWTMSNNIGFVEVGDDDMLNLAAAFPWGYVIDMWGPMGTGALLDSLYVRMSPAKDNFVDGAAYPNLNGIIRNAIAINVDTVIGFRPFNVTDGRCEADADVFGFAAADQAKCHFLAYEQGLSGGGNVGADWDYNVVTAIQDTLLPTDTLWTKHSPLYTGTQLIRRAVSLSIQPQFLVNTAAAQQFTYDGIMWASLEHQLNPTMAYAGLVGVKGTIARSAPRTGLNAGAAVRVTDIGGRTVFQGHANDAGKVSMSTQGWKRGIYVMSTLSAGKISSTSFVVGK